MKKLLLLIALLIVSASGAEASKYFFGMGAGVSFLNMDDIGKTAFHNDHGKTGLIHTDNTPMNFNFSAEALFATPNETKIGVAGGFTFARHRISVVENSITNNYNVSATCVNLGLRAEFKPLRMFDDYSLNFCINGGLLLFNTYIEDNPLGGSSLFFMPELRFGYRMDTSHDVGLSLSYLLDAGYRYNQSSRASQWGGIRLGAFITFF